MCFILCSTAGLIAKNIATWLSAQIVNVGLLIYPDVLVDMVSGDSNL